MKQKFILYSSVTALLFGFPNASLPVHAENESESEEAVERIQVLGDFRARGIEDVPASVSVISKDDLEQRQATHIEDILAMAANVNLAAGASRGRFFQIRGVGERSQFVDPINPSVGLVIDGINYSGLGAAANTFDIGQVEVFRGPQSTRFGADGMAGVIYLSSTPISDNRDGKLAVEWGNYDTYSTGLAGTFGITENSAARISVQKYQSDGFTRNIFLGSDDTQNLDETTLRFNSDWRFNDDWQGTFTLHHFDVNNGYDAFSLDLNRQTLSDTPGVDALDSLSGRAQFNYNGWPGMAAEFSVSLLEADELYAFDEDWAYEGIRPDWEYNSYDEYQRDRSQQEIEVRLLSTQPMHLGSLTADWLIGSYFQSRTADLTRNYTYLAAPFSSRYETQNAALYGELNPQLSERVRFTFGLRMEQYDNDYVDSRGISASPDAQAWGGRAAIEFKKSSQTTWFASLSRGFKSGGVNGEALGRVEDNNLVEFRDFLESKAEYEPEYLTSIEFGARFFSPSQSLRAELISFYSWRDDMQVNAYVERSAVFVSYRDNASSGINYGVEGNIEWIPLQNLRLFMSVGWLQTEFDDLLLEDGSNLRGREQAHAPNYQAHAGFEWQFTDAFNWRLEVDAKDAFYYSNSHDERSDSYQLLHTRANYRFGSWTFSVYARNLLDKDYTTRGFFFGNDPRDEYTPKNYVQYGEPRRVGVSAQLAF